MKIAVFHNLNNGGAFNVLEELCSELTKKHQLDLYSLSLAKKLPAKYFRTIKIYEFKPSKNFLRHHFDLFFKLSLIYKKMAKEIDSQKYDLVFVNPCQHTQAPMLVYWLKTKTVYFCQETLREFYEPIWQIDETLKRKIIHLCRWPIKLIDRISIKRAGLVLANSKYMQRNILKTYAIKTKLNYLGVNVNKYKISNQKENYILSVGFVSIFKGFDFIIKSLGWSRLKYRAKLVICGHSQRDKQYFLDLAKKMGVNLEIKVGVSEKELKEIYAKAKIFCYAAYNEPFGLVVLEALASGLAVAAVNEAGVAEILAPLKEDAFLVARGEKMFSRALEQAWNKKVDRQKLVDYVKNNWSLKKCATELEKNFKSIYGK